VVARGAELLRRRGALFVVSDLYDAEAETQRQLRLAARRGHDAGVIHVLSPAELSFPYQGEVEMHDMESGQRAFLDARESSGYYGQNLHAYMAGWRRAATRDGIDYELVSTGEAPERVLRRWLLRRAAQHYTHQPSAQAVGGGGT
jgi:hypothetical protein